MCAFALLLTGKVNAHDVYEIDRFDTWDLRRITITPEDNKKYYSSFDHIMSHYWQEEILGDSCFRLPVM